MAKIVNKLQNLAKKKIKKESEEELALKEQATDIVSEANVATADSVAPVHYAEVESVQTITPTIVTDATVGTAAVATEMPAVAAMYALSPLAVAGMGLVLSSSNDNCATSSTSSIPTPAANKKVEGITTTGPIIAGNELTVELYKADGVTKLGSNKMSATGTYSIEIGTYSGVVIAKVVDANNGLDFKDEATKVNKDLTAILLGITVVGAADAVTILNINPLTTIAAQEAGVKADGTGATDAAKVDTANAAVAAAFKLKDIDSTTPITTLDATYNPTDGMSDGEAYGAVLAALSGADKNNNGNMQAAIDKIVAGLTGSVLNADAKDELIGGADSADENTTGDLEGDILDLIDPVAATKADTALAKIKAFADAATPTTAQTPTAQDYIDAGIKGVDGDNLTKVNEAVATKDGADAESREEIRAVVAAQKSVDALAKISAYATDSTDATKAPTIADYKAAGVTGVDAANLSAINVAVAATDAAGVDTLAKIQTIVTAADQASDDLADAAAAALAKIATFADAAAPTAAQTPTAADYAAAGVRGVDEANLPETNAAVAATDAAGVDTLAKIQTIATAADKTSDDADAAAAAAAAKIVADALAKIATFADAAAPTAAQTPTAADYAAAGVRGVDEANLAETNAAVAAKTAADVNTVEAIQAIATAADTKSDALATIKAYADNDTANIAPTVPDYTNAGVTDVTEDNKDAVNAAIAKADAAGADTLAEIQAIVKSADSLVITSAFAGATKVENFGVSSNIVLTASENITAVAGKKIKIINDGGAGFHGEATVHSFEIAVDDATMVTIKDNKITINPNFDLDLANNYHIEIEAGAFKAGDKLNAALSDATAMDFSTVTPGTASVANAVLATKMDASGLLVDAFKWLDIENIGSPSANTPAALDVASGNIALVTKDYNPEVGNTTNDGIGVNDFNIKVSNFALGDLLYIDNQDNNINLQNSNLPADGLPTDADTKISYNPYNGSLGGVAVFADTHFSDYSTYQVVSA